MRTAKTRRRISNKIVRKPRRPPSERHISIYDAALQSVSHLIEWSSWEDSQEVAGKTLCCALALIKCMRWQQLVPDAYGRLTTTLNHAGELDLHAIISDFQGDKVASIRKATEFILTTNKPKEVEKHFEKYVETEAALALVEFVLVQKPCCQLCAVAWSIPWASSVPSAIPLLAHTAHLLAEVTNDPTDPMTPDCITIGNSWLHRLGVYLLHCCQLNDLAPPPALVRLMSIVTAPSSSGVKSGKAIRTFDFLTQSEYPVLLHNASPAAAVGKMLALELLGELDANRQDQFFRKLEHAVAFCAVQALNGNANPSIKSIQTAASLSWSDAKKMVARPFFRKLVFEHQCRHIIAKEHAVHCPECQALQRNWKATYVER